MLHGTERESLDIRQEEKLSDPKGRPNYHEWDRDEGGESERVKN